MTFETYAGLALHHVGHAVRAIEPASEIYVQRYGYQVCTPIIHDPTQTALVQFLGLPRDRVYLELVSPDGPESRLTNAVRKGGALNHLCYAVDNLESAGDWLVQTGMMLLSPAQPAVAFAGRRICWLMADDGVPIELVERNHATDFCVPGIEPSR